MVPSNPVTEAAAVLMRAAPIEFMQFVDAYKGYADELAQQTVLATHENVILRQGHARQVALECRWFHELMHPPVKATVPPTKSGGGF